MLVTMKICLHIILVTMTIYLHIILVTMTIRLHIILGTSLTLYPCVVLASCSSMDLVFFRAETSESPNDCSFTSPTVAKLMSSFLTFYPINKPQLRVRLWGIS